MPEFNRLTTAEGLEEGLAEEVAIVPRGAVGRTIAFRKEHTMKLAEIMKAVAGVPLENEAEIDKVLKEAGLDGEAAEAAKAIARLAGAYSDKLSGESLATALNAAVTKGDEEEDRFEFGKPKKQDDDDDEPGNEVEMEKAKAEKIAGGPIVKANDFTRRLMSLMDEKDVTAEQLGSAAGISASTVGQILRGEVAMPPENRISGFARALGVSAESLMRLLPEEKNVEKNENSPTALLARIAKGDQTVDLTAIEDVEVRATLEIFKAEMVARDAERVSKDAEVSELRKSLDDEKGLRIMKELVDEVSKKYSHLPGAEIEEVAKTLKTLREKAPEAAAKMEKILENSSEAIRKGLLGEITGDAFGAGAASNAISRVDMAADAIRKSGETNPDGRPLTKEQSIDLALQRNPELYSDYTDEAGIQDGRTR